jgi:ABC-2 type transport system permease protein
VISVPIFALIAVVVCVVIVWTSHGVPIAAGAAAGALAVVTCVLFARVTMAVAALVLRERRSRELTGLVLLAVLVVVVPAGVFLASLDWNGRVPVQLGEAVDVLALTPIGAAWAIPAPMAEGSTATAGEGAQGAIIVAAVTAAVLAALWLLLVRLLLTTTERPVSARERAGLGWFLVAPGTPGGAIAARSLVYWMRDRRYLVNVVIVPIAAAVMLVPLAVAGVPGPVIALVPVPIMALFFGWLPHNDLAYDSTAVWMHLSAAVRGASDRIGRLVPVVLIAVPILAVTIPVAIALHGRWAVLPALVGVTGSLFLCGLGLSSISSAAAPYAVSRPGDSPFQQPQRTGGGLAQGLVLVGAIVLSAPALWWGWLTLTQDVSYADVALWGGLGIGLVVLVLGVLVGGRVFERGSGRLMEFAEST